MIREPLAPHISPIEAACRLAALPHPAFLDSALAGSPHARISIIAADPVAVFTVEGGTARVNGVPLAGHPLDVLRQVMAEHAPQAPEAGFCGGAIGFFAYEFGRFTETFPPYDDPAVVPDAWFGIYDTVLRFDHANGACDLVSTSGDGARAARFRSALATPAAPHGAVPPLAWSVDLERAAFMARVEDVRARIHEGEVFQVNIARRFSASRPPGLDALAFYQSLRTTNPAPFAAYLDGGGFQIASSSPERFLKLEGSRIEARPIKGTIGRGTTPQEDARARQSLLSSAKDRAENVMIVDLLRNDLSKVARPFSVKVPGLCEVESFANLHHLVSAVEAELEEGRDAFDLVRAAFPGGSITGAPKVKAMELIARIEGRRRGVYCGSIGWIGFSGDMDLNIGIRTVTLTPDEVVFQAGGGITWGSDAGAEFDETEVKAARIRAACPVLQDAAAAT